MTPNTAPAWSIGSVLEWTTRFFLGKEIASARLDAELLLADTLNLDRVQLYIQYNKPLLADERTRYRERVQRRAAREPVAYILGWKEFYGLRIMVTSGVLIPRPESELLVERVEEYIDRHARANHRFRMLEPGTGSGAISVAACSRRDELDATLTDISSTALELSRRNIAEHNLDRRCQLLQGDLFAPVSNRRAEWDIIVMNPPYIPSPEIANLQPEIARFEPREALDGGRDGLDVIRRLLIESSPFLLPGGILIFEIGAGQWPAVRTLADEWHLTVYSDLQGIPRVVEALR